MRPHARDYTAAAAPPTDFFRTPLSKQAGVPRGRTHIGHARPRRILPRPSTVSRTVNTSATIAPHVRRRERPKSRIKATQPRRLSLGCHAAAGGTFRTEDMLDRQWRSNMR